MALAGTLLKRLPLSAALLYLLAGVALGPHGLGLIDLNLVRSPVLFERLTEVAVIVSLFTAGLKLRLPASDRLWRLPIRLASLSMVVTVALIAAAGVALLGLSPGAAVLLGAILAPTDPVLASDVQVEHPSDRDRLRFGLTGEAGLNDGTAFPFVMLGLGMLGLHDLGSLWWKWAAVDVAWAVSGGLGVGAAAGTVVARLVLYLRKTHKEAVGLDEFLSLGLLALAYGLAVFLHAYGFLAVFAAGVALRRVEAGHGRDTPPDVSGAAAAAPAGGEPGAATDPETAPAYMAQAVLGFNAQLERICEVAVVLLVGALLSPARLPRDALWFVPVLFLVIRPLAVVLGLAGMPLGRSQRALICWFGVRGVGSIYYVAYAVVHGVGGDLAERLTGLVLAVVAASVVAHGISVTPLMNLYARVSRTDDGRGGEHGRG
jgi:NhaP-type Na+/H+ or K+/H+ antiporter